jgi:hypothetical protein
MIAAARWMVLLAAVHQRPGWQIALVVAASALAGKVAEGARRRWGGLSLSG